jgi:hypothetical protein
MERIRKQIDELTPADLEAYPMWEFAGDEEGVDGQDEATVRPLVGEAYDNDTYGVVRARFTLADGSVMTGFLTPPPRRDPGALVLPQIITSRGHVGMWLPLAPSAKQLEEMYQLLERTPEKVFPIRYETDFPVVGGPVTGRLDGFEGFEGSYSNRKIVTYK